MRASSDVCSSSDNLGVEAGRSFMLRNLLPEGSGANGPWARWVGSPMMQAALDGRLLRVQPLQPLNFRPQSFSTVKRGGTWMCTADDRRRAIKVRFASKMIFFPGFLLSSCQLPVDSNTAKEQATGKGLGFLMVTNKKTSQIYDLSLWKSWIQPKKKISEKDSVNWKGKLKLLKCVREDIAGGVCDNTLLSVPPVWPTRQIKILSFFFLFLAFPVDRIGLGITDLFLGGKSNLC